MSASTPVRVLHIGASLGGGGSERLVWDAVRLSDPTRVRHCVVTVYPDNGRFVYAPRLAALGAHTPTYAARPYALPGHTPRAEAGTLWSKVSRRSRGLLYRLWQLGYVFPTALARVGREYLRFRPHVIHGHTSHGFAFGLVLHYAVRLPLVHSMPCLFSQMVAAGHAWMPGFYAHFQQSVAQYFTNYPAELLSIGVPARRILPYRGFVDVQALGCARAAAAEHRGAARRQLGIPVEAPIALSVGRLDPSKGHHHALEALPTLLERCPELHWVVLGEGAELPALEARARALGVDRHAHLLGYVEDPLPWYAAADVYLRTSIYEADNLSSYQAMGVGAPVVGFDTGSQTELIPRVGHGWLVPNGDSAALAQRVAAVLAMPDRGRSSGSRGIAYCAEHLDIRLHVEDLTRVYERLSRARATQFATRPRSRGRCQS